MSQIFSVFIFLLVATSIHAEEIQDIGALIQTIDRANKECTRGTSDDCSLSTTTFDGSPETGSDNELSGIEVGRVWIKGKKETPILVSVIDEDSLQELRNMYPSHLRVYDDAVCAHRAHTIGETLAKNGIETAKLYLQPWSFWPIMQGHIIPDSRARNSRGTTPLWEFHVVNVIHVREKSGQVKEYIIDPFMEGLAVPREKWEARIRTNPNSSIDSMEYLPRYNFGPTDSTHMRTEYDESDLREAYRIMSGDTVGRY